MSLLFKISIFGNILIQLLPCCAIYARSVVIDDAFTIQNLSTSMQVFASPQQQIQPEVVLQHFQKDTTSYQKTYLNDNRWVYYWVYMHLQNCSNTHQELIIEIDNPHIDTLHYWQYDPNNNNIYTSPLIGDCLPFDARPIQHRNFLHQFTLPRDSNTQFLFRLAKYGQPITCRFNLSKTTVFYEQDTIQTSAYMFISGMLLSVIFLVFFLIPLLPKNSIFLGISLLFLLFNTWWHEGYGFQYLWQHTPLFNNFMRPSCLVMMLFCWWLYIYLFFNVRKNLPKFKIPFYCFLAVLLSYLLGFIAIYCFNWIHYYKELKLFLIYLYSGSLFFVVFLVFFLFRYVQHYKNQASYRVKEAIYLLRFVLIAALMLGLYIYSFYYLNFFPYAIIHHAAVLLISIFIGFIGIYTLQIAYNSYLENRHLRESLSWSLIEGQEQERQRIGSDLHDGIINSILLLRNTLNIIEFVSSSDKNNCVTHAQSIAEDVRRISHQLMPVIIEKGNRLETIIEDLCSNWKPIIAPIQLTIVSNVKHINTAQLPPSYHLFLYRILQELISNIIKHSQATKTHVHLYEEYQHICLLVIDNGVGFDNALPIGLGFKNIKKRVAYLNGYLNVMSDTQGTTVEIGLPLKLYSGNAPL